MDCFGTCFTHVQTCDYVRGQSATQWTASKPPQWIKVQKDHLFLGTGHIAWPGRPLELVTLAVSHFALLFGWVGVFGQLFKFPGA